MNKIEARSQAIRVIKGIVLKRAAKRSRPELKAAYKDIAARLK